MSGTEIIYGLRAALAVFEMRRDEIERIAFAHDVRGELDAIVRFASQRGLPCKEERPDALARLAQSQNHEGLCVVAKARKFIAQADLAEILVRRKGAAIALDRVRNPYNVGAIIRTAAFFGIDAMILGAPAPHPALAPDAVRVAEGGAEHIAISRTTDLGDTLARLRKQNIAIVGADGHAKTSALTYAFTRPVVLVVGHERDGISTRIRPHLTDVISIEGASTVESLNVAVATGILISKM